MACIKLMEKILLTKNKMALITWETINHVENNFPVSNKDLGQELINLRSSNTVILNMKEAGSIPWNRPSEQRRKCIC